MAYPDDIIIKDPEILGGMPVFRGTRVPFKNLLDYLEGGHTLDEFLDEFPSVTREAAIGRQPVRPPLRAGAFKRREHRRPLVR
jgi:uncharacterized protein (DUF433 family)